MVCIFRLLRKVFLLSLNIAPDGFIFNLNSLRGKKPLDGVKIKVGNLLVKKRHKVFVF